MEKYDAEWAGHTVYNTVIGFSYNLTQEINVAKEDMHGVLAGALYIRCIELCTTAYLLANNGMQYQAEGILRMALEALFKLAFLTSREENYDHLAAQDFFDSRKNCNKLKELDYREDSYGIPLDQAISTIDGQINQIKKRTKVRDMKVHDYISGIEPEKNKKYFYRLYKAAYTAMSASVHANIKLLIEQHVAFTDTTEQHVDGLKYGACFDEFRQLVIETCEIAMCSVFTANNFFKLQKDEYIEKTNREVHAIPD